MPTSTFFHLSEGKRAKLLSAARAEFARVPYPTASINRIIHAAGIPRGSFYMYFADKGDLFYYLLSEYGHLLVRHMEASLSAHGGDLIPAFLTFFDVVVRDYRTAGGQDYEALGSIMRLNPDLRPGSFLRSDMAPLLQDLAARIDRDRLDLQEGDDLELMLSVLISVTGHAIQRGILAQDPAPIRSRLAHTLHILARGMAKTPAPASSHT